MNPLKLRYHDLLVVLVWEIHTIYDLFKNDQKYECLLEELKKYDIKDRGPLPYQKDLLKTLDMSRTQLMNLMHKLYNDFQTEMCNPGAYQILDTEIWFLIKSRENYWVVGMNGLKVIPRVGDSFLISFVRNEFGSTYANVESIDHEIENGKHVINIHLSDKLNTRT